MGKGGFLAGSGGYLRGLVTAGKLSAGAAVVAVIAGAAVATWTTAGLVLEAGKEVQVYGYGDLDAGNYERLAVGVQDGGAFEVTTEWAEVNDDAGVATGFPGARDLVIAPSGTLTHIVGRLSASVAVILPEQGSAPAAVANAAVLYAEDTGGAKTRLMIKWPGGGTSTVATEP